MTKGFSIFEVLLAAALFVIFSTGVIALTVQSMQSNRLAQEQTIATQYASEGIEAIRSIRNQSYTNLSNNNSTGVIQAEGVWTLSGISNTFEKYTRMISISDVYRDNNGNIVSNGGVLDPDTKKIISKVIWNFGGTRNNSVEQSTYLTNWRSFVITTPTPTLTPTITPTLTLTNTPTPTSALTITPTPTSTTLPCNNYCLSLGYRNGTCRQNSNQCIRNGEIYIPVTTTDCNKACCCLP